MTAPGPWNVQPRQAAPRVYNLAWFFYLLLAATAVVWIGMRRNGTTDGALFFDAGRWPMDLGLGVASGLALVGLWALLGRLFASARRFEELIGSILGSLDVGQAIGLALLSGFAEELFFRGAVQGAWGFWIASALFTALHSGRQKGLWVWTLFALLAGLLFGGLVLYTGNLLAAMIGHVTVNAVNLSRLARRGREQRSGEATPAVRSE
jgi:membrane protease YdiL (CAAX protease family)